MATTRPPADTENAANQPPALPESPAERLDRLFVLVQDELRGVAHGKLVRERVGHTLSTTGLVNETYLRLVKQRHVEWTDRGQFFALASRAMRRILIDYARRQRGMRNSLRYDSNDAHGDLSEGEAAIRLAAAQRADELLALDDALERLAVHDERLSRVVECRFFAGYTEEETAQALGVTARTVGRDWVRAKAWLYRELSGAEGSPDDGRE